MSAKLNHCANMGAAFNIMRTCSYDTEARKFTVHQDFYGAPNKDSCTSTDSGNVYTSASCRVASEVQNNIGCNDNTDPTAQYNGIKGVTML